MKQCFSCGLPETYETLEIDDKNNNCNICKQHLVKKNIDWNKKHKELIDLSNSYRNKHNFDCIVPFSGGKDSTFTLWYVVKKLKLKPLVVQFNHGFFRPTLINNNRKTFKKLGVNVLSYTPNWQLVKKLMRISLERKGDFCWHCHAGIFAYPIRVAVDLKIPLVIWGEPSSEYTAYYNYEEEEELVDRNRFDRFINLGINAEDMEIILNEQDFKFNKKDLEAFTYPDEKKLAKLNLRSICLGSYIPWDVKKQVEIIKKEVKWQGEQVEGIPEEYFYEKIECYMQGVRDYIKLLKRGYGRVTQMTALDRRNGRMSKEKSEELIFKYENKKPHSLDLFLDYLEISEEEFNEIVSKTVVPPHEPNFSINQYSNKTWDFDTWFKENN